MSRNLLLFINKSFNFKGKTGFINNFQGLSSKFKVYSKSFTTDHKINEKQSLEYIEAGVFEVLKSAAKCKQDKLNRAATLEELGFDSLDVVELVIGLEERFSVNISGKV